MPDDTQRLSGVRVGAIFAVGENGELGFSRGRHGLPWHLPEDLAHFKQHTQGRVILMGRTTSRILNTPLPRRLNLVLTSSRDTLSPGFTAVSSLEEAVAAAHIYAKTHPEAPQELLVIGGAQTLALAWPKLEFVLLTLVHGSFEADTYLPTSLYPTTPLWRLSEESRHKSQTGLPYTLQRWEINSPNP